jgi:hypothetical protein
MYLYGGEMSQHYQISMTIRSSADAGAVSSLPKFSGPVAFSFRYQLFRQCLLRRGTQDMNFRPLCSCSLL